MAHTTASSSPPSSGEFGRGKTIFVLAVVVACFAVLWPKVFYPMFTASIYPTQDMDDQVCCDVISEKDTNAYKIMTEICTNIIRQDSKSDTGQGQLPDQGKQQNMKVRKPTALLCRAEILKTCGVDIIILLQENAAITKEYKESLSQLRSYNTSHCLKMNYGVDFAEMGLPKAAKGPLSAPSHMRPERPLRAEMVHPALREKGRAIPTPALPRRTIEREARPGPVPGVRPPVGGAGHVPSAPKGSGTMGIIMPMYTIGIVCFFVYTLMKILFKKAPEEGAPPVSVPPGKQPILKDYGMDPEHRKFVFAEEYTANSEKSLKDEFNKEDRDIGVRRKSSTGKGRFHEDKRRLELENEETPPEDGEQSEGGEIDQTVCSQVEQNPSSADTLSDFDTTAILDASTSPGIDKLTDSQRSAIMAKYFADSAATSFSETFSDSDVPPVEPEVSATIAEELETTPVSEDDVKLTIISDSEPPYPETNDVIESIEIPSASTDAESKLSDSFSEVKLDSTLSSLPAEEIQESEQSEERQDQSLNSRPSHGLEPGEMEPQTPNNEVQKESLRIQLPSPEIEIESDPAEMEVQTPVYPEIPVDSELTLSLATPAPQQQEEREVLLPETSASTQVKEESSLEEIKPIETEPSVQVEAEVSVPVETSANEIPEPVSEPVEAPVPQIEEAPVSVPFQAHVNEVPATVEISAIPTSISEPVPPPESSITVPTDQPAVDSPIITTSEVTPPTSDDSSSTVQSTESLKTEVVVEKDEPQLTETTFEIPAAKNSLEASPVTKEIVIEPTETTSTAAEPKPQKEEAQEENTPSDRQTSSEPSTPAVMNPPLALSSRDLSVSQADLTSAALFFDKTIDEIPDEAELEFQQKTTTTSAPQITQEELAASQEVEPQKNEEEDVYQIKLATDVPEDVREYAESLATEILAEAKSTATDSLSLSLSQPSPPPAQPEPVLVDILITQPTPTSKNEEFPSTDPFACVRLNEAILFNDTNETEVTHSTDPLNVKEITPEPEIISAEVPSVSAQNEVSSVSVQEQGASNAVAAGRETTEGKGETLHGPVVTLAEVGRKNSEPILCRPVSDLQITPVEDIPGDQPLSPDGLGGYVTMADDSNKPRLPVGFLKQLRTGVEISSFDEKEESGGGELETEPNDTEKVLVVDEDKISRRVMSMDSNDSVQTVKELDIKLEQTQADLDEGVSNTEGIEVDEGEFSFSTAEIQSDGRKIFTGEADVFPRTATTEPAEISTNSLVAAEVPRVVAETSSEAAEICPVVAEIPSVAAEVPPIVQGMPPISEVLSVAGEIPPVTAEIPSISEIPSVAAEVTPLVAESPQAITKILVASAEVTSEAADIVPEIPYASETPKLDAEVSEILLVTSEVLQVDSEIPSVAAGVEVSPIASEAPLTPAEISADPSLGQVDSESDSNMTNQKPPNVEGIIPDTTTKNAETEETSISVDSLINTKPLCPEPQLLTSELSIELKETPADDNLLTKINSEAKVAALDVNVGIVDADNACPVTCTEESSSISSTPIQPDVVDTLAQSTVEPAQPPTHSALEQGESIPETVPETIAINPEGQLPTPSVQETCTENESAAAQPLTAETASVNKANLPRADAQLILPPTGIAASERQSNEGNLESIPSKVETAGEISSSLVSGEMETTTAAPQQPQIGTVRSQLLEQSTEIGEENIQTPTERESLELSVSSVDALNAEELTPKGTVPEATSSIEQVDAPVSLELVVQSTESPVDQEKQEVKVAVESPAALALEEPLVSEVVERESLTTAESHPTNVADTSTPAAAPPIESPLIESPSELPSEDIDADSIPLEFETIDPSEINFTLTRAPVEVTVPSQPSPVEGSKDMEIEFVPSAESKSVPPIQKPTESGLRASGMAVESQVIQPQEVENINRVETPEISSSSVLTSTDLPASSSTNNKHVGVMFSLEFETATPSAAEDSLPPQRNGILGDTVSPAVPEVSQVAEAPRKVGESEGGQEAPTDETKSPSLPAPKIEEALSQPLLPSSEEASNETGQRDRDATVKGILDALAEQTSSTNQSESLPKSDSEKVQPPEEELEKRKECLETPVPSRKEESPASASSKASGIRSQKSVEKEVKFQLPEDHHSEEEEPEEEEVVRPPTPPRTLSKKSKHKSDTPEPVPSHEVIKYAQVLSGNIMEQSASAAIAAAKAQSAGGGGHKEAVSVVGFEETAELESGGKWGDRTPTPTFRMATPPVPHRPPTPPKDIPSIFLEGPLPISGQQFMVSDSQVEVEGGGDDDEDNYAAPIVLSGKVTLSVISGVGVDDLTEASSISYDDRAQAGASSKKAIKTEKGLSSSKKSPVSSPDMDEYEVIKSAEADGDGQKVQEDTAGDISEMDGLGKQDDLPQDVRKDEE